MKLDWRPVPAPGRYRGKTSKPSLATVLPGGYVGVVIELDDGSIVAELLTQGFGEKSSGRLFTSMEAAKAWVEEEAHHLPSAPSP